MATKIYKIGSYELYWWALIKIDFDHTFEYDGKIIKTADGIKEMVEFWAEWQWRLKDNHNDYTLVFLKQLAAEIINEVATNGYNLQGILAHFRSAEGWLPMDGSAGITITEIDHFSWSDSLDFDIEEVEQ